MKDVSGCSPQHALLVQQAVRDIPENSWIEEEGAHDGFVWLNWGAPDRASWQRVPGP